MTLKFIQDIKAEIDTLLPDNSTGLITPAILRTVLQDMTDSLYSRAAALYGAFEGAPVAQLLTATPTNYPALYNLSVNNNPSQFTVNQNTGEITVLVSGFGMEWDIEAVCDGTNGIEITGQLYKNGVAQSRIVLAGQASGAGELFSLESSGLLGGVVAGDVFELRLSGTGTINFSDLTLVGWINPTYSQV